jgi:rare lipoprotein A
VFFKARPYIVAALAAVCMTTAGAETKAASGQQAGVASWYGPGFHGRKTANGERFNMNALTAAHRTLPLGTQVRVTNTHTGRSVVVRINDRGPYVGQRVIDLSKASAQAIGVSGLAKVSIARL